MKNAMKQRINYPYANTKYNAIPIMLRLHVVELRRQKKSFKEITEATGLSYFYTSLIIAELAPELLGVWCGNYEPQRKLPRDRTEMFTMREGGATYEEIGNKLGGVTRERIRQILKKERPDLIGHGKSSRHIKAIRACEHCGKTGKAHLEFYAYARPVLCREHHPQFRVYLRYVKTAITYHERYQYIQQKIKEGVPKYRMGFMWKGVPFEKVPYINGGQPPTGDHVWATKIVAIYEKTIGKIEALEVAHPWLRGLYERHMGGKA